MRRHSAIDEDAAHEHDHRRDKTRGRKTKAHSSRKLAIGMQAARHLNRGRCHRIWWSTRRQKENHAECERAPTEPALICWTASVSCCSAVYAGLAAHCCSVASHLVQAMPFEARMQQIAAAFISLIELFALVAIASSLPRQQFHRHLFCGAPFPKQTCAGHCQRRGATAAIRRVIRQPMAKSLACMIDVRAPVGSPATTCIRAVAHKVVKCSAIVAAQMTSRTPIAVANEQP